MNVPLTEPLRERLLTAAREAAGHAYCPYSQFHVGAALLIREEIITGCNVENASYGLTICAERVAVFRAVASGLSGPIEAVALCCRDAPVTAAAEGRMPCGACRQVLAEFASADLPVLIDGVGEMTLRDLLPRPFMLHRDSLHDRQTSTS